MKVVIPIYPNNPEEEALLEHQVNGSPLAFLAAKELCRICDTEVHVFTGEETSFDYSSCSTYHHRQPLRDEKTRQLAHLPLGTRQCIEYITRQTNNLDETVLIVDYRTTNLSMDLLNKASCSFMASPLLPLLSVQTATDNPAQFHKYYRIITMDILSVLDTKNTPPMNASALQNYFTEQGSIWHTNPIPFNWVQHGFPGGIRCNEFFVRLLSENGYKFIPFNEFTPTEYPSHFAHEFYFKESADSVRRFLQIQSLRAVNNDDVHAVSAMKSSGDAMCLLTRNKDDRSYSLFLQANCWEESDIEIRLQPFSVDPTLPEKHYTTTTHILPAQRPPFIFNWQDSLFYGPAGTLQSDEQADGFIVSVLSRHIDEKADFSEPMELSAFCSFSPDNSRRINKETGLEITGRQTCPKFFQTNSAFVFSRLIDLSTLEEKILTGETRGFAFHGNQIRTEFDALCMQHAPTERSPHDS